MSNDLKNSIQFINEKSGKKTGFSIPEDYFEGIENDFSIKLSEKKLPKKISFQTPDTYFDSLENTVINKVSSSKKTTKVISLKRRFIRLIPTVAAACLLVFIVTQSFNKPTSIDSIAYNDIETWFDENVSNTDLTFVFDDDLDENELLLSTVNINQNDIEDYLTTIDYTDLIDETE